MNGECCGSKKVPGKWYTSNIGSGILQLYDYPKRIDRNVVTQLFSQIDKAVNQLFSFI